MRQQGSSRRQLVRGLLTVVGIVLAGAPPARSAPAAAAPRPAADARCQTAAGGRKPSCCFPDMPCWKKVLRYRALGLPEKDLGSFLGSGRSLTHWYNHEHIGGDQLETAGWVLVVLGILSVTLGATGVAQWSRTTCGAEDDICGDRDRAYPLLLIGVPALVAGILELGAGLSMGIVGTLRTRRWAKDGELDALPIEELREYRSRRRPRPKTDVSVLPYLGPGGGGMTLSLRF